MTSALKKYKFSKFKTPKKYSADHLCINNCIAEGKTHKSILSFIMSSGGGGGGGVPDMTFYFSCQKLESVCLFLI